MNIYELREMLETKKSTMRSDLERQKLELISLILQDDNAFSHISYDHAVDILTYLGVPRENVDKAYSNLTTPEVTNVQTDKVIITENESKNIR